MNDKFQDTKFQDTRWKPYHAPILAVLVGLIYLATASGDAQAQGGRFGKSGLDIQLKKLLARQHVRPIRGAPDHSPELVALGQALFFDPILSGNRDTSCATCHHPLLATGDSLALPVGTGTETPGLVGPFRIKGEGRPFVPRNAPEVFNRGSRLWTSQFWDSRVAEVRNGRFISPAGQLLPKDLDSVLAVQAMFPVTSRDEMRGSEADGEPFFVENATEDADGDLSQENELARIADGDFEGIWDALMARLLAIPEYRDMFRQAYQRGNRRRPTRFGFEDAANAIAAFEAVAFHFSDSPFDRYLGGRRSALNQSQKRGAILFFGKAKCSTCHAGTLLTDQQHYHLAVPQLGPGKDPVSGLDLGRYAETGDPADLFRFRTPPLRNVTETGPWMHNGAFGNLEDAVRHHLDPQDSLSNYDPQHQLAQQELWPTVHTGSDLLEGLDIQPVELSARELRDLLRFLESLTAPDLAERLEVTIPQRVPSGLPVDGLPGL